MTGEGSQFPISQLAAKYRELTTDGKFLSNRQSMQIIGARVEQLAQRIDLNEAPERLKRLLLLWQDFKINYKSDSLLEARKSMNLIDAEFEAAYHDYAAWEQMFEALDLHRKMVESEVKIAKDMKSILTAEDAYALAAKLLAAIIEAAGNIIFDNDVRAKFLKRVQYEFARLIGDRDFRESPERPGGSSGEIIDTVAGEVD